METKTKPNPEMTKRGWPKGRKYNKHTMNRNSRAEHIGRLDTKLKVWLDMCKNDLLDEMSNLMPGIVIVKSTREECIQHLVMNHVREMI